MTVPESVPASPAARRFARLLPHALVWALAGVAVGWLLVCLWPLLGAVALAATVAALAYPVLAAPVDARLGRWWPGLRADRRRVLAALFATGLLIAAAAGLALAVLWSVMDGLTGTWNALVGIVLQDPLAIARVADVAERAAVHLHGLYPSLPIDPPGVRSVVQDHLRQTSVGPAFLRFLATGSGALAQAALAVVVTFFLLARGHDLVARLLAILPIDAADRASLAERYRHTALHVFTGLVARAAAHGFGTGLLAYVVLGLNPVLVGLIAGVLALLPLVGPMLAWVPLAGLAWSQGHWFAAGGFASTALLWGILVERLRHRLAKVLGTDQPWLSFALFLAIVGGLLGEGPRGLIVGPGAVLAVILAAALLRRIYRLGGDAGPRATAPLALPAKIAEP